MFAQKLIKARKATEAQKLLINRKFHYYNGSTIKKIQNGNKTQKRFENRRLRRLSAVPSIHPGRDLRHLGIGHPLSPFEEPDQKRDFLQIAFSNDPVLVLRGANRGQHFVLVLRHRKKRERHKGLAHGERGAFVHRRLGVRVHGRFRFSR